ncbi:MAG: hypothetical protein IAX21_03945 [Candidatus Bathyarchaeota archaeon]|nr:MAG: hypothetical protein NUK63_01615 [Candidatus Bathyarchaeum tardum]WNZ30015.1 MAG: hypothetical protein IAX21_03945 [Candidatus Bathyarchaeota archaeon]
MTKKRAFAYVILSLVVVLAVTSPRSFSQEITPKTLVFMVFVDGFVSTDYVLEVDPEFPTQNVTVFGQVLEDLLVVDEDGLPLSYSLHGSTISVHSLGTTEVEISYLTQDITSKQGKYWTLTVAPPIAARIILPSEAAIISLNKVPELIQTSNDKVNLLMDSGLIQVTYVVGIVGTPEHARMVLDDAELLVVQIQSLGVIVTDAETKLQQGETAFSLGNYAEAETLGTEAKNLAIQINQTAVQAQSKIVDAENVITVAEDKEQKNGLDDVRKLVEQAHTEYEIGNYSAALSLATQAIMLADVSLFSATEGFPILEVAIGIIVFLFVVALFFVLKSRNRTDLVKPESKKRDIDVERIFAGHKDLLPEEKQAIQFLVDNNGEAFEADLYDYVKLPRTTTWRMVKRLKGMNIITVTKFRRQNLVRIKSKYNIKD